MSASHDNSESPDPLWDQQHFEKQTWGDERLQSEMLDLFQRQSILLMKRIQASLDQDERKMAAHTLKGSATGLGALAVAKAAGDYEHAQDEVSAVQNLIDVIEKTNHHLCHLYDE
jgi:HPt (histidine-containing phosphotransfer) domain-containing protein